MFTLFVSMVNGGELHMEWWRAACHTPEASYAVLMLLR